MKALRTFEEYLEEGIVRKDRPDIERAKSMIEESDRKMRSLQKNISKVGLDSDNANDYAEHCYDLLLFLIRARMYSEGLVSSGKGAHEAEISYLRVLKLPENDVLLIDELRYWRNGMLYYGKSVDEEYAEKVIRFTKRIQPTLKKIAAEKLG